MPFSGEACSYPEDALELEFCKHYHRVAWYHEAGNTCLLTRLRCKQWSCDYCANANRKMWRAFLAGQLPIISNDWYMVTLTAHPRMRTEEMSYKNLQRGIDVVMKRIRRVFGKVQYVRVFEKHPTSAALHAHLLISDLSPFVVPGCNKNLQRSFLPITLRAGTEGTWSLRTWLKKSAHECHIGHQAAVEKVRDGFAVWYVCKYLSKADQQITVKGLRHVSTSRRIGSPQYESDHTWEVGNFITPMDTTPAEAIRDLQLRTTLSYGELCRAGVYPPEAEKLTNGL